MNLFENETLLSSADDQSILLTSHRIRSMHSKGWGHRGTTSIMLEKISSIQSIYIAYPVLLIIGGLLALTALARMFMNEANSADIFLAIIAIVLIAGYYNTRRHVCIISSDGGAKIEFSTQGSNETAVHDFMDSIEKAKVERLSQLIP